MAAAMMVSGTPAQATTLEVISPHFPYQAWLEESRMPTPEVALQIVETGAAHGCPARSLNYAGCTSPEERTIWLAPEAIKGSARKVFYHELGHNVDYFLLQSWMRERFMLLYGLSGEWTVMSEPETTSSPSEVFAEVWAECARKPYIKPGFHLGVGPVFQSEPIGGAKRHNAACRMLDRL